jgi:hypothetical protein
MIRTRIDSDVFESVEILQGDMETGEVMVKRLVDSKVMETWLYELRADDGIKEIAKAIESIK